eukprot:1024688-Pelagomonas_calceolata.AAC.3
MLAVNAPSGQGKALLLCAGRRGMLRLCMLEGRNPGRHDLRRRSDPAGGAVALNLPGRLAGCCSSSSSAPLAVAPL